MYSYECYRCAWDKCGSRHCHRDYPCDMFNESTPRFEHDCDNCVYMGTFKHERYGLADWYVCQNYDSLSIIARTGNEAGNYASFAVFGDEDCHDKQRNFLLMAWRSMPNRYDPERCYHQFISEEQYEQFDEDGWEKEPLFLEYKPSYDLAIFDKNHNFLTWTMAKGWVNEDMI